MVYQIFEALNFGFSSVGVETGLFLGLQKFLLRFASLDKFNQTKIHLASQMTAFQFFPSSQPGFFTDAQTKRSTGDAYITNCGLAHSRNGLDRWFQVSCALVSSKPHYTDQ